MIKDMATEDMSALMSKNCVKFIIIKKFNKTRSNRDIDFCITESPCIRLRIHFKIKLWLWNANFFTYWWKMPI